MRLLLDEMYPARSAVDLRVLGVDAVAVLEVPRLVGATDHEVLEWAVAAERVVVTENVRDLAAMGTEATSGLLLVNAARWPRTRAGQARLREAITLRALDADGTADGATSWL